MPIRRFSYYISETFANLQTGVSQRLRGDDRNNAECLTTYWLLVQQAPLLPRAS